MLNLSLASSSSFSSGLAIQNPKPCSITDSLSSRTSLTATRLNPHRPRTRTQSLSLKCRHSHNFESQPQTQEQQRFVSFSSGGGVPPRVFVGHSIYKGKAALTVEPRPPEFVPLESGAFKLVREGYVLLQFAPAAGIRQYDWSRKQVFSLSVTEIGTLIGLGARESCEFFHDPFKGKSDEGKVRKVLKVEPLPDGSGHFFNLSVQNKLTNVDDSIYIPITKAEYTVLTSAFNFVVPYLLGWHTFANSVRPEDINHRSGSDFEWSR